jgi:GntR family transcriptional regulator/MocR family aminotransferase
LINLAAVSFVPDRASGEPLFAQLCDRLRERIAAAGPGPERRLPPTRALAAELGISRSTVVTAYEQLVAEGYIEGRRGSGYYVRESSASDGTPGSTSLARRQPPLPPAADRGAFSHPGYPDNRLFPYRRWARTLARSARLTPSALIDSRSVFGDPELRRAVAAYLADWRGLEVSAEQVMITAGSVDALETCIRTLAAAGQAIGLENPGYQPLRHIAENQGMKIRWLALDADGARLPPASAEAPVLVVLTPSHQFPLGGAMPVARRQRYLQWASGQGAWIVEDDYDNEFRYAGRPIPALTSLDSAGRSIYIGTFSKVFSVSLRLGYLIMPTDLIGRFEHTLARFGVKAALPCQRALADFIDGGDFYRHIRRVRRIYADRRRALVDGIRRRLADHVEFVDHHAGMQITVSLAPGLDDREVAADAASQGARVTPLSIYYGGGDAVQGLLLGFCPYTESEIDTQIEILARVLDSRAPRAGDCKPA